MATIQIRAQDLKIGDRLVFSAHKTVELTDVVKAPTNDRVYVSWMEDNETRTAKVEHDYHFDSYLSFATIEVVEGLRAIDADGFAVYHLPFKL
jgi:hypothetical protein